MNKNDIENVNNVTNNKYYKYKHNNKYNNKLDKLSFTKYINNKQNNIINNKLNNCNYNSKQLKNPLSRNNLFFESLNNAKNKNIISIKNNYKVNCSKLYDTKTMHYIPNKFLNIKLINNKLNDNILNSKTTSKIEFNNKHKIKTDISSNVKKLNSNEINTNKYEKFINSLKKERLNINSYDETSLITDIDKTGYYLFNINNYWDNKNGKITIFDKINNTKKIFANELKFNNNKEYNLTYNNDLSNKVNYIRNSIKYIEFLKNKKSKLYKNSCNRSSKKGNTNW